MAKSQPAKTEYFVVLVTCGSQREALRIARAVVAAKLAACVNVPGTPMRSIYRWKGKVQEAREFLLVIKTSSARLDALRQEIERLHSYNVPEFIALPITAGSPAYLKWLRECVTL